MRSGLSRDTSATAAGLLLDRLLGEPPTAIHPVVGFGRVMGLVEEAWWADRRMPGIGYALAGAGLGGVAGRLFRSTSGAVSLTVAGRELRQVASEIDAHCRSGDIEGARAALPSLVGRNPSELDESGIAAAVIESLAENTVDAVIAPVFWAVVAGAPGAAAYRAINTMDAMVGHKNERYLSFGWAAARLDDAANYLPARLFAALVALAEPSGRTQIVETIRRDSPLHPSPNAGVAEAAVAGALGVELGGPLRYGATSEIRPRLGTGPRPEAGDIGRAIRLVDQVEKLTVAILVVVALVTRRRSR